MDYNKEYIQAMSDAKVVFASDSPNVQEAFASVILDANVEALDCFISWVGNQNNPTREKDVEVLRHLRRFW